LIHFLELWEERLNSPTPTVSPVSPSALVNLIENAVRSVLPDLHELVREIIPDTRAANLSAQFFQRVERLELDLPPSCANETPNCFAEILSAGWAYQIVHGEVREGCELNRSVRFKEYEKTCRLILKSIELTSTGSITDEDVSPDFKSFPAVSKDALRKGGVMGMSHIAARLQLPPRDEMHLDVTPVNTKAIQAASLDLRLGHWFAVDRRTRMGCVELGNAESEKLLLLVGRELVFIPPDHSFVIHPGDLVLGATLEFVALPADVMAFVEGRSGLGRKGLIVATATQVAPGFHGVIILEMANAGTLPLAIKPRMPIAQLVLQGMTEPVPAQYHGRYYCQVHP